MTFVICQNINELLHIFSFRFKKTKSSIMIDHILKMNGHPVIYKQSSKINIWSAYAPQMEQEWGDKSYLGGSNGGCWFLLPFLIHLLQACDTQLPGFWPVICAEKPRTSGPTSPPGNQSICSRNRWWETQNMVNTSPYAPKDVSQQCAVPHSWA